MTAWSAVTTRLRTLCTLTSFAADIAPPTHLLDATAARELQRQFDAQILTARRDALIFVDAALRMHPRDAPPSVLVEFRSLLLSFDILKQS